MTVLGLKLARRANAVSALHGEVSRAMWTGLYPGRAEDDVPIGHVTNGVHVPTWLAPQMARLYDRHLGVGWRQRSSEPRIWDGIEQIDDAELWETHLILKARLIDFVRRRAGEQGEYRAEPADVATRLSKALSLDALTIGFGRRFATYKRATLLFRDPDRLARLVGEARRPVQFLFAGKAHPRDDEGKNFIRDIVHAIRDPRLRPHFVFLEDYDLEVARYMVQGCDVWLNNPRRPLEASGTSGQKVVLNGGLNCSVLDGWWAEAYDGTNGFAIGKGTAHVSDQITDERDAEFLYQTLENEVIPLFYERDVDGLPRGWIQRMANSISSLAWRFSAHRMVMDYVKTAYLTAAGGVSCDMSVR
jgi:starch phosphorylase